MLTTLYKSDVKLCYLGILWPYEVKSMTSKVKMIWGIFADTRRWQACQWWRTFCFPSSAPNSWALMRPPSTPPSSNTSRYYSIYFPTSLLQGSKIIDEIIHLSSFWYFVQRVALGCFQGFISSMLLQCTGWHIRLWRTSHWHKNKSSILAWPGQTMPKRNLCFEVNERFDTTWCVTL